MARRVPGNKRVFAVVGDPADRGEVMLHHVKTWATFGELMDFCNPQKRSGVRDGYTKEVVLGEQGAVISGGMSLPFTGGEEPDSWMVRLGNDRPVKAFGEGTVVTLLASQWQGAGNAALWQLYGTEAGQLRVTETGVVVTGVDGFTGL